MILALLLSSLCQAQQLDYLKYFQYHGSVPSSKPIHLPSGRILIPILTDSFSRSGTRPCQDRGYQFGRYQGIQNEMMAVIKAGGDTDHFVNAPFHIYKPLGGWLDGDRIHSIALGNEFDSCWGGYGFHYTYGMRTLDTNGNVLDSISLLGQFDDIRWYMYEAQYDKYGVTLFGEVDDGVDSLGIQVDLALIRFGYDGLLRFATQVHINGLEEQFRIFADTGGGYYAYCATNVQAGVIRVDSLGNLRSFERLRPVRARTANMGYQRGGIMADGGKVYSYIDLTHPNDTSFIVCKDRLGYPRYTYFFRGEAHSIVPLDDNSLLVFRTLIWDSIPAPNRHTVRLTEALQLDSTGNVMWQQQIMPRPASRREWFFPGGEIETSVAADGSCFFITGQVKSDSIGPGGQGRVAYGHISGIRRYDPSATKPTYKPGQLTLYPNPATTQLSIGGLARAGQASIVSASGQVVKRQGVGPGLAVPLGDLPAGLYYLRLEDGRAGRFAVVR